MPSGQENYHISWWLKVTKQSWRVEDVKDSCDRQFLIVKQTREVLHNNIHN